MFVVSNWSRVFRISSSRWLVIILKLVRAVEAISANKKSNKFVTIFIFPFSYENYVNCICREKERGIKMEDF
jgi:hypothetical protein